MKPGDVAEEGGVIEKDAEFSEDAGYVEKVPGDSWADDTEMGDPGGDGDHDEAGANRRDAKEPASWACKS